MDTVSMDSSSVGAGDSASLWSPGGPWKSEEEGKRSGGGSGVDVDEGSMSNANIDCHG